MDTQDLRQAGELVHAYTASINLYGHLQFAGLDLISRDALEIRNLLFAEMLTLYIQTDEDTVRTYFHETGIGDRLLEEARTILRGEGLKRMDYLETVAVNRQRFGDTQVSVGDVLAPTTG